MLPFLVFIVWSISSCNRKLLILGPYDCDFTDNTCGWRQSSFDDFEWAQTSEGTPSRNTGPDWDHTGLIEGVEESHGNETFSVFVKARVLARRPSDRPTDGHF
jgi:hypothetical protein